MGKGVPGDGLSRRAYKRIFIGNGQNERALAIVNSKNYIRYSVCTQYQLLNSGWRASSRSVTTFMQIKTTEKTRSREVIL